ncbi:MAG TPA: PPC domain-containing protein [Pirellulales bacterium]|nr:PPC domain-containing protein [Pirellulales bacterium]
MRLILHSNAMFCAVLAFSLGRIPALHAETPNPVLQAVSPAGAQAGTTVAVTLEGTTLEGLRLLRLTAPGFAAKKIEGNRFDVSIAATTPPGIYDLRAVTDGGVSNPRAFMVGRLAEQHEGDSNDTFETPTSVELNSVVNGKIEKPGDVDCFRFAAKAGQRVVIECWAERIDSQLRGVIELFDAQGRRLAVSRGHSGLDPLVDFRVPADGWYDVRLFDLSYLGGNAHFYRLDFDTLARPEFVLPCVVARGRTTRVKLFGRNLPPSQSSSAADFDVADFDVVEVDVTPPSETGAFIPLPRRPSQIAAESFAYYYPAGHLPLAIGVTDVPVIENIAGHDRAERALQLAAPCEVSAQIAELGEQHWYALYAKRGEVLWFEALGDRIGSPVDLELSVLDPAGDRELAKFSDQVDNLGGYRFSTAHADPAGRWVAPADGRYLVLARNLIGEAQRDPRRIYRLSVRREEPDFQLAVVSRRTDQPAAWNVPRGGRELVEVLALRRRGMTGPIRVTAENLPAGMDCPDAWIGPGQERAPLVVTAASESTTFAGAVNVIGHAEQAGVTIDRRACGGAMIWPGQPLPSGRVTQEVALATSVEAPLLLTATPKNASIDQLSSLDVQLALDARSGGVASPVHLSCVGLPQGVDLAPAVLPPETSKSWMSFFWPASLPPGPYTFAIQAEFEVVVATNPLAKPAKTKLTVVSNPITIEVKPARIILEVDSASPKKIARGKIIQLQFTAERVNGFIGKVHTELTAPGGVVGLRARGVTLTGQSDSGSLQVIATDNAPLGRHALLRLEAVGTVEDQPIYRASRPVELEIVE